VLRTTIRPYDICVRYAGDEFIVVLAGCGADEAEHKRRELQQAVDHLVFEARPQMPLALSISAGAAVFPQDGDSYDALLATADSRMYSDKAMRKREASRQLSAAALHRPAALIHPRGERPALRRLFERAPLAPARTVGRNWMSCQSSRRRCWRFCTPRRAPDSSSSTSTIAR
jgi:GGDEF domain-containing protein